MEFLKRKLHQFRRPTNINEAMYVPICFLKLVGMFPYTWLKTEEYKLSPWYMTYSIVHLFIYCYVNLKLIVMDIEEYSAPVMYNTTVGVAGQVILKLLSAVLTLVIFARVIFGRQTEAKILVLCLGLLNQLNDMGLDIKILYKRLFRFAAIQTVVFSTLIIWSLINGIVVYDKVYHTFPTFDYFFIAIMSNLYKYCGLMYLFCYLYVFYDISNFARKNLETVFEQDYSRRR